MDSVCFSEKYQSPGQLIQICFGADESCFTQYQKRVKILKTIYHFRSHGLSGFGTKSCSVYKFEDNLSSLIAWLVLVSVTSASNPKVSYEAAWRWEWLWCALELLEKESMHSTCIPLDFTCIQLHLDTCMDSL